jgi:putative NIF3 family GTP cyclohydrolase 1 type 2
VDTEQIMAMALKMSGLPETPTDSGIWVAGKGIRRILLGLDITSAELNIAQQMGFDLALAHHPPESTLYAWRCYLRHVEQLVAAGVPRVEADALVAKTTESMQLGAHARNFDHTVSVAQLLGMPFMNIHTPLDEIGRQRMQTWADELLGQEPRATVGDVLAGLQTFEEVRAARLAPFIAAGAPDGLAGRVIVAHGALDIPDHAMLTAYFEHGYGTAIVLRVTQQDKFRLQQDGRNVVVVGHNAGDSIGIVPFVSALRQQGLEVTTFSGIIPQNLGEGALE